MSKEDMRTFNSRRRILLYLIEKYLKENGFNQLAGNLKAEALLQDYEICDNVELDSIFLEYCSYFNLKFGKFPNILRKTDVSPIQSKPNTARSENKHSVIPKLKKTPKRHLTCESPELNLQVQVRQIFFNESDSKESLLAIDPMKLLDVPSDWEDLVPTIQRTLIVQDYNLNWKNIIGNSEAINTLNEATILPLKHPEMFTENFKPWKSVLLHGPPGCGKTLIAKTLCSEALGNICFFNISPSVIMSKWRGESEKLINIVFKTARLHAPSIIFFDEVESLTSTRDNSVEHEATRRFKNEFLSLMDGLETENDGIFILAISNLPWQIDEAFLRRFEKKILIKLPDSNDRRELLHKFLPDIKNYNNEILENLIDKCNGFTGDEIRIVCKEVKMKQLHSNRTDKNKRLSLSSVTDEDIFEAIGNLKSSSEKLMKKHENWHNKTDIA